jgi:glycosyltransferase involved in cell wall biosynthesis
LARTLIVHNRYRQPGGEDTVAAAQAELLRGNGHEVRTYERSNTDIDAFSFFQKARLFFETTHNPRTVADMWHLVHEFQPQVAYVHNTLPLISPSVYGPLHAAGVKVVQWLHNYRLVCPAGTLYRAGAPCNLCEKSLSYAVRYKCWTGSALATRAVVRMLKRHRRAGTWHEKIDLFVALNEFQREILVRSGGLPADKIVVQPNFSDLPETDATAPLPSFDDEYLFIGRLTEEKGIRTLLKALRQLREVPIAIVGDGPLSDVVAQTCALTGHRYLGRLAREDVAARLRGARGLLFTSEWPEGCPSVILEAMAAGKPVIASSVAGARELVQEGRTGLFFQPGNADALAECVRQLAHAPDLAENMGRAAFARFTERHSRAAGYAALLELNRKAGVAL